MVFERTTVVHKDLYQGNPTLGKVILYWKAQAKPQ